MPDMNVQVSLRLRDQMGARAARALRDVRGAAGEAAAASRQLADAGNSVNRVRFDGMLGNLRQISSQARTAVQSLRNVASAASTAVKAAGQAVGGVAAGGAVAGRALAAPIDYERRLALMANTAFAGRDVAGLRTGRAELDAAVVGAVRHGGGRRDDAADALDRMLASGAVNFDAARTMLPVIQKYATASGAASGELADILIRGVQQGFFAPEQAEAALEKALVSGQEGGFEIKDMARWLPQMMANAAGMKGMAGFERLLASAQASAVTAGSKDQAGNNLVNLLGKLNSADTARDFAARGINLSAELARGRERGELPLDTFIRLIDTKIVGNSKRFQALRTKLESAQGSEKESVYRDMVDILQASAIGKVVQDRQALLALVAEMTQRAYVTQVREAMADAQGKGDASFRSVQDTTAYKLEQAQLEKDVAASGMLANAKPALDGVLSTATSLAREFPTLTTVAMEATTAIGAMSAAAAAFGGLGMLMGGRASAGGGGEGTAGTTPTPAGRAARMGRAATATAKGSGMAAAVMGLFNAVSTERRDDLTRAEKNAAHVGTAGGMAGMVAGATAGAALGSVIPVIGTALGGLIGGALGQWGGSELGELLGDWAFSREQQPVHVEAVVQVDGREIARAVNEVNGRQAARH